MITGEYHRLEGIVTLRLPGAVDAEAVVGIVGIVGIVETVEVAGEDRGTRDLVVRPAETPDTTERAADPDRHTRRGHYMEYSYEIDYTTIFDLSLLLPLSQLQRDRPSTLVVLF